MLQFQSLTETIKLSVHPFADLGGWRQLAHEFNYDRYYFATILSIPDRYNPLALLLNWGAGPGGGALTFIYLHYRSRGGSPKIAPVCAGRA
ncbi:hypothetical protein EVAR_61209_1 [Eumeta japonica]|uniref:Uncharacterized protein n=1 Tax=Eumeta variegata TaxID=151549 RepID=A0A4C1YTU3_EUMVA|nr:hypothetical protein EVAR_61209_1 [Eumeta japonica]